MKNIIVACFGIEAPLPRRTDAALLFVPYPPRRAKNSTETAGISEKNTIFAASKRNTAYIMTTRREKSKPQKPQINKQLEPAEKKPEMENTWIENLGKYLLDISKYVTTGVVVASLFKDMDDSATIYIVGTVVAVSTLIVGLVLTNKKRKKEE